MYLLAPSFKKAQLQISAPTLLDTTEAHMRLPNVVTNVIIGYMQGRCKRALFPNLSWGLIDVKHG